MTSPPSAHPQTQSDRDAGLTATDYQPIDPSDVTPGTDHVLVTHHWPDKERARPIPRIHRVTVEAVEDGWVTVTAREELWAPAGTAIWWPTGRRAARVLPGDRIRVQFIGRPWSEVSDRLDAHRDRERRRLAGLDRVAKELPTRAPAPLGDASLDLQGVLDLLDTRARLEAAALDLQQRLEQMTRERDHALAAVDDLEDELAVLGEHDRVKALIVGREDAGGVA